MEVYMKSLRFLTLLVLTAFFVSCGNNGSFVKDVNVETFTGQDNQVYVDLTSVFDLGLTTMPALDLPLRHRGVHYGRFVTMARIDGKSDVLVRLNLTEAFRLPPTDPYLPNGSLLPVADLVYADSLVEIPVPEIKTSIYLAAVNGRLIIGFASVIKGLDRLSSRVGSVNVFPRFEFGSSIGIAGIFTGEEKEQSGIALFAAMQNIFPLQVESLVYDPYLTYQQFEELYDQVENPDEVRTVMYQLDQRLLSEQMPRKRKTQRRVNKYLDDQFFSQKQQLEFYQRQH